LARGKPVWDAAIPAAREILDDVRRRGDLAVLEATERLDGVRPGSLLVPAASLRSALHRLDPSLRSALEFAALRIERFHRGSGPVGVEHAQESPGSRVGTVVRPLDRVGVYVPGGPRGYPSTALMGTIPARLAGVRGIVVATPPSRETGMPPDAVLAAAALGGATAALVAGGAQAIGALAYGTETVRPVDKIVGPGNAYVTAAKLLVADAVGTDGIAGPSEVLVVADATLSADALAVELLAQAEHDSDATAIGVLLDGRDPEDILHAAEAMARRLPAGDRALSTLRRTGTLVRVDRAEDAVALANGLSPEHLVLAIRDARRLLPAVRNAGAVFLGAATSAAFGDYVAGTNHILPTAGSARWRGGLGVHDFVKTVSVVELDAGEAARLASAGSAIAAAEGFDAHAAALRLREGVGPR
jgi:histidinol dehydrogenase